MFGALRRCPAHLSRHLSTNALSSSVPRLRLPSASNAIKISAPRAPASAIAAFHNSTKWRQEATAYAEVQERNEPITQFKELALRGMVHPNVINTLTKQMKLETMTDVQTRTINEALSGVDVIAQAKTGTGKTLGFLIPVIQRIISEDPKLGERTRGYKRARPDDIRAIVISPTRELAEQIAVEAKKATDGTGLIVQVAVGGTQKNMMLQRTQREGCHILIGTPGRLNDILSDTYSGIRAPKLSAFVLDEADRLLDQGFTEEIEQIKENLPDPEEVPRQTMMFSATIAPDVVALVRRTMKPGFHFARCVDENEVPTHEKVPQKLVNVEGFENLVPTLYELIAKGHQEARQSNGKPFKAIVYFNSTAEVRLNASVFAKLAGGFKKEKLLTGIRMHEIHAKLSQAQRTRASDNFRYAKSGVLFSSDVTARGMDFPNVTHVIQVGLPRDRESYIHRIGRTGRAGKEGEGWLILTPFERSEVRRRLRGLPLVEEDSLEVAKVDMSSPSDVPENVAGMLREVTDAYQKIYPTDLDAAFKGLFGSFQWYADKQALIEGANRLAEFGWGMEQPPVPPAAFTQGLGRRGGRPQGQRGFGGFGGRDRSSQFDRGNNRGFGGSGRSFGGRQGGDRSFGGRQAGGRFSRDNDRPFEDRRSRRESNYSF